MKDSTPGKIYVNVKTHKIGNPTRVILSGCNKAIENLSIFVEIYFMVFQVNYHQELMIQTICWTLLFRFTIKFYFG